MHDSFRRWKIHDGGSNMEAIKNFEIFFYLNKHLTWTFFQKRELKSLFQTGYLILKSSDLHASGLYNQNDLKDWLARPYETDQQTVIAQHISDIIKHKKTIHECSSHIFFLQWTR